MNNIHKHFQFKLTEEGNNNIRKLLGPLYSKTQQQSILMNLQKTHTNRHYYTFYIQPSIRT